MIIITTGLKQEVVFQQKLKKYNNDSESEKDIFMIYLNDDMCL